VDSQGNTALTLDDFLALCEAAPEGVRYEAVEGRPVMMSGPSGRHQKAVAELLQRLMTAARPSGLWVLPSPLDWVLWQVPALTVRQPDLVVVTPEQGHQDRLTTPPVLAVEVLSRSTRTTDVRDKRQEYARAGATRYWVVDIETPSIEALVLDGDTGTYRTEAVAKGDEPLVVDEPFPVAVIPADLVVE
jgi:Uma2 family endonuclease